MRLFFKTVSYEQLALSHDLSHLVVFLEKKLDSKKMASLLPGVSVGTGKFCRKGKVVCKSQQPAKFAGFSARFRRLLSLLHE